VSNLICDYLRLGLVVTGSDDTKFCIVDFPLATQTIQAVSFAPFAARERSMSDDTSPRKPVRGFPAPRNPDAPGTRYAPQKRKGLAKGAPTERKGGRVLDLRIMATLPKEDFEILAWWAAKHQRSMAEELRRAVWAYVHCLRPDFPGSKSTEAA
jgi:hypothetical protein